MLDNKSLSEYIETLLKNLSQNKDIDSYLGQLDFDPDSYIRKPLLHIFIRFYQYLDVQADQKNHMHTPGANFAMQAKSYAAVGGYADDVIAEDIRTWFKD